MSYHCSICNEAINEKVNEYSRKHFGKPLCLKHQKIAESQNKHSCSDCGQAITYGEFKFSMRNFDKPLCRDCQPEEEEKVSAAPNKFPGTYKIEVIPKKKKQEDIY